MPEPGFVFWGLFIVIGLIICFYTVWMWRQNEAEKSNHS